MKAYLEVVRMNLADVITTSTTSAPCGNEYTPEIGPGTCKDPEFDE